MGCLLVDLAVESCKSIVGRLNLPGDGEIGLNSIERPVVTTKDLDRKVH